MSNDTLLGVVRRRSRPSSDQLKVVGIDGDIPNVTVEPEMLKLAEHILQSKATDFDPSRFVDRHGEAVVGMLKRKQAGIVVLREQAQPHPKTRPTLPASWPVVAGAIAVPAGDPFIVVGAACRSRCTGSTDREGD